MKQFIVLMLVFNFSAFSGTLSQEIKEFNVKDANLKECITKIEKMTNLGFLYKGYELKKVKGITVKESNIQVEDLLNKVLDNTGYVYEINKGIILISKAVTVAKQKKTIVKGIVQDSKKNPLPGVSVVIKGTNIGVSTDVDGKFEISVPDLNKNTKLVFSFIGMTTKEVEVYGKKDLRVTMEEEKQKLDEVVITGYANINKKSFTGNVKSIDKESIIKTAPKNVMQSLQLLDPSLRLVNADLMGSNPNNMPEFYIRGKSGIGTTELDQISEKNIKNNPNLPTFILDGFEVSVEKIYDLDINMIENITILKDAAATAIYGSRAANGVIVIERVAPKAGEVRVSYNLNMSVSTPDLRDYNLFDAKGKLEAEKLSGLYDYDPTTHWIKNEQIQRKLKEKTIEIARGVNTDWLALPTQTVFNHRHGIFIEGGHDDLLFGIDLKYNKDKGVMKRSYRDTKGFGFNLSYRKKNLLFKNYFSYELCNSEESPYGQFSEFTKYNPYVTYKNEDGSYPNDLKNWGYTPMPNPMLADKLGSYNVKDYKQFTNNFSVDWYISDYLRLKSSLSFSTRNEDAENFRDPKADKYDSTAGNKYLEAGSKRVSAISSETIDFTSLLIYNRRLNEHNVNVSYGLNIKEDRYKNTYYTMMGFSNGDLDDINFAAQISGKPMNMKTNERLIGSFLTSNYTYRDIYLADVSFRVDGSSNFGTNKRFAPFWSAGAGVNIHEYSYFKNNVAWLSFFKVRGSYGETGKTDFSPNAAKSIYAFNTEKWYISGLGATLSAFGNNNLKWEKTKTLDFGIDAKIFGDRVSVKADYYIKKTEDLISDVTVPASVGFSSYMSNVGELENKGYEIFVNSNIIKTKDAVFNVFASFIHNKNKMLKISQELKDYNDKVNKYYEENNSDKYKNIKFNKPLLRYTEGASLSAIYAMKSLGINPANGREVFVKKNGDLTYEWDAAENMVCGDTEPEMSGTFGCNAYYKGFSLYAGFQYEFGGQVYNQTLCDKVEEANIEYNADKRILSDRWINPGDYTSLKDIRAWGETTLPTSRFVQDNNFVSLSSISLSYDLPKKMYSKLGLRKLKIQFNTDNVFRLSSVKQERGIYYPYARTYNFTINAKF